MDRLKTSEFIRDLSLPLCVVRREPQPPYPLHSHEFSELVMVYAGSGIHFNRREEFRLESGNLMIIHGNMEHGYRGIEGLSLLNIIFDPAQLHGQGLALGSYPALQALRSGDSTEPLKLTLEQLDAAMTLAGRIEEEISGKRGGYRLMSMGLFMQLAAFIARCFEHAPHQRHASSTRLGKVLAFMENNYPRKISLEELTRLAGMSPSSLTRAFLKYTGETPVDYLIRMRMERAAALLTRFPDRNIGEIASETGFQDSNYFSRQFRRFFGINPAAFRKKQQSPKTPPRAERLD